MRTIGEELRAGGLDSAEGCVASATCAHQTSDVRTTGFPARAKSRFRTLLGTAGTCIAGIGLLGVNAVDTSGLIGAWI